MWILLLLTFVLWYRFAVAPARRWRRRRRESKRSVTLRHSPPTLTRHYHH